MKYFTFNEKAISYSIRIFLGAVIVWWSLYYLHDSKKVWALISVIVVSDPDFETVRATVFSRSINTISGCLVGLAFIFLLGINIWSLLSAIIISVIISTSFKNYPASWKLAPVTVVIIMTPAMADMITKNEAITFALTRTAEVMYGSLIAFLLGFSFLLIEKKKRPKSENNTVQNVQTPE
jgi:uncharacterized membrane protein YccC